jgi:hypothetical protein
MNPTTTIYTDVLRIEDFENIPFSKLSTKAKKLVKKFQIEMKSLNSEVEFHKNEFNEFEAGLKNNVKESNSDTSFIDVIHLGSFLYGLGRAAGCSLKECREAVCHLLHKNMLLTYTESESVLDREDSDPNCTGKYVLTAR